jgi:hypothetical protein
MRAELTPWDSSSVGRGQVTAEPPGSRNGTAEGCRALVLPRDAGFKRTLRGCPQLHDVDERLTQTGGLPEAGRRRPEAGVS